jgi:hypothetical protein
MAHIGVPFCFALTHPAGKPAAGQPL